MARLDVFELSDGLRVLDCQSEELDYLTTRFIVPLVPLADAPKPAARLNPVFDIAGEPHMMVTQFAATMPTRDLTNLVGSLGNEHFVVIAALDMLISGY
ncbi:CcdB family protein [Sphingomonas sp. S1-29]|uniref:CcdB family protein n=1 Tax=Sphingomonas sp. S1-29 TaxID=2991074 RepID=UPI0022407992|nr:CcdB family protein [Sphingomonas sp. S1-29]UZK68560.1 CcdB family protein [Sphingomonas sp. S1-29]